MVVFQERQHIFCAVHGILSILSLITGYCRVAAVECYCHVQYNLYESVFTAQMNLALQGMTQMRFFGEVFLQKALKIV